MVTILLFIVILGLLVVVHEWGHYYTAKKSGIKVYEFGFGYPPRVLSWYRDPATKKIVWIWGKGRSSLKKTVAGDEQGEEYPAMLWSINLLPLGGFVRIKGENGEKATEKDSFGYHKPWKRIVVLAAGVIMNVVFAGAVLSLGFMIGLPADVSGGVDRHAIVVGEPTVLVQSVEKGSPAESAGILFGDKIVRIDDVEITNTSNLIEYISVQEADERVVVHVVRAEEGMQIPVFPTQGDDGISRMGVGIVEASTIRYPWYIAIYKGFVSAGIGLVMVFISLYHLFAHLITGQGLLFEISGPVGIAQIVGQSARLGFEYVLNVTAMLSLSLAAINILPIPALDGGRILFVIIEKILGRPVSMKYEQIAHTVGFMLLMLLIVVVTWRDVAKLF